jgi:hypothetical protein
MLIALADLAAHALRRVRCMIKETSHAEGHPHRAVQSPCLVKALRKAATPDPCLIPPHWEGDVPISNVVSLVIVLARASVYAHAMPVRQVATGLAHHPILGGKRRLNRGVWQAASHLEKPSEAPWGSTSRPGAAKAPAYRTLRLHWRDDCRQIGEAWEATPCGMAFARSLYEQ